MKKVPWWAAGNSGKLGNVVYYTRKGKTYVRKAPVSHNITPTQKQAAVRERFIAAHKFAQNIIADPTLKQLYTQKAAGKRSAYSEAMAYFFRLAAGVDGS